LTSFFIFYFFLFFHLFGNILPHAFADGNTITRLQIFLYPAALEELLNPRGA